MSVPARETVWGSGIGPTLCQSLLCHHLGRGLLLCASGDGDTSLPRGGVGKFKQTAHVKEDGWSQTQRSFSSCLPSFFPSQLSGLLGDPHATMLRQSPASRRGSGVSAAFLPPSVLATCAQRPGCAGPRGRLFRAACPARSAAPLLTQDRCSV